MRKRRNRAAALITVLAVVVLATILVVGLTVAMRMDRQAAYYHLERERAGLMAREGVETARAILRAATGTDGVAWISQPGRIVTSAQTFELSSGAGATNGAGVFASANLNRTTWQGNDRILDPQGTDLPLQWIYVRRDGTRETHPTPAVQPDNPIVGRYAYWVDDESTRVNLNTAWRRQGNSNTNTLAAPSLVSLEALGLTSAEALQISTNATNRAFNTPLEALNLSNLTNILATNRFLLTHYTQDSDLNPWGEPKIVLTTQKSRANGSTNFLDILSVDNANPGLVANLNSAKVNQVLQKIAGYLTRTNWPYAPNSSFAQKYYPADTNRVWQLATDIVEYVRCAESTNDLVQPIRGRPDGSGGFSYNSGNDQTNSVFGTVRRPMITEVGVWVTNAVTNNTSYYAENHYLAKYVFEVYLPPNYGISTFRPLGRGQHVTIAGNQYSWTNVISQSTPTDIGPGQFATVTQEWAIRGSARPTNVAIRVALGMQSGPWADIAPLASASSEYINCEIDPPGVPVESIKSVEVNDPRVNKHRSNWVPRASGNTFGTNNSLWQVGGAPGGFNPPQDTDGGVVSAASLRMPYPAGHSNNFAGQVTSVTELGVVTTGVDAATTNGVPWRSVRLQPTAGASTNVVPDWALLDLFTAPALTNGLSANLQKLYAPHENTVAGRINLNAGSMQPLANAARTNVLAALFTNVSGVPADIVSNVENLVLASAGRAYGDTNLFDSVGELAEIEGVADGGESTEQTVLRQVLRQATVRGNVFSVYSIGQAIKQTPAGTLVVNGEKMLQTMIERYTEGSSPKYRVVYWREINP